MSKYIQIIREYTGKINWKFIKNMLVTLVGKKILVHETNEIIKVDKKFIKEFISLNIQRV